MSTLKVFPWRGWRRMLWRFKWSKWCPKGLRMMIGLSPYDPKKHLDPYKKRT